MPIFARILDEKYIKTFFMINPIVKTIELPDGRTITLETGKLAKQADGSVMLRMGNTMLLATVCAAKDAVPGTDFMPLQVEYKEKYSAFGRFPGGFTKREGKASDYEILTCRLVDRALRPLFPDNFHAEVYVNIVLFSADGIDMPDALAGLDGIVALDSAKLGSSGSFSFAQKRPESPEFYRLRLDNKVINFAVDSTETVSVKAEINDFATAYRIEGSENNLKIKELVLLQADLQKNVDKLGQNRNIPAGIAQDSLLAMVNNYKNKVKREYIFAAPNMPYAYFALFQSLNGYMIFNGFIQIFNILTTGA
jgi:hypothetical protein